MWNPGANWQQMSLVPPDRVHVRLDCYIIGSDPLCRATSTVWTGAQESLEAMWTLAVPLDASAPADVGLPLAEVLIAAQRGCTPF